jgi:hypothetical protein
MSIVDVKLAQLVSMLYALIIVKLVPQILEISIWWFAGLLILLCAKPFYTFWLKKTA